MHLPNVVFKNSVSRAQIAGLMRAADVCIMPHLENNLTTAMSPLKVYEYIAAGKPVVATDLGPVRGIHPSIHLIPPSKSFVASVQLSLREGGLPEVARKKFIDENSWRSRFEELLRSSLA